MNPFYPYDDVPALGRLDLFAGLALQGLCAGLAGRAGPHGLRAAPGLAFELARELDALLAEARRPAKLPAGAQDPRD